MELNYQREAEKRAELRKGLSEALRNGGTPDSDLDNLSKATLESFVSTQPPEAPRAVFEFVVVGRTGRGGGQSTKPGNIRLNIGKLLDALATGVLTSVGAAHVPFTVPLAALVVWNSLRRAAQVKISETEACVLYTMWLHRNADRDVLEDGLLDKCNALLGKYDRPVLSKGVLKDALETLEKIETIERSPRGSGMWWLREWVSVPYR